ncbi:MAG: response regulator transcription factor [Clostridiales bacterium]|nr:response regulator transcription factor [Clostridiales bacterium]
MNGVETILIADDDQAIAAAVEIYLAAEGYRVLTATDGMEALEVLSQEPNVSLIIMDVMMPRMDGIRATMKIREERNIPIIMLSAKSEDYDKVAGLGIGADDYVTKPFNPLELVARVKSHLRRYKTLGGAQQREGVYTTGGLVVDDEAKTVTLDGDAVTVTPIEFGILSFLTQNAGRVFSIGQIYEAVWNEPSYSPENTVAVHIRRIREKIEINPGNPRYLKVVWGIGYKMERIERNENKDLGKDGV